MYLVYLGHHSIFLACNFIHVHCFSNTEGQFSLLCLLLQVEIVPVSIIVNIYIIL